MLQWLAELLKQDLDNSLIPHSLYAQTYTAPTPIAVPLVVCGALDDYVIAGGEHAYQKWRLHLKENDRLWLSEQGKHFLHYSQWQSVSNQIRAFWNSLTLVSHTFALK
jgi:surfactin synthase thioesterase subunit